MWGAAPGGAEIRGLHGRMAYVAGSLDRLREGATATLMRDGRFACWSFAGEIRAEGRLVARVRDSAPTPEGLAVVWDGERLSIGNAAAEPRDVSVAWAPGAGRLLPVDPITPVRPDGSPGPTLTFLDADTRKAEARGEQTTLTAVLRAPGPAQGRCDVPTALASFRWVQR